MNLQKEQAMSAEIRKLKEELEKGTERFRILFEEYQRRVGTPNAVAFLLKNKKAMYGLEDKTNDM